MIFYQISHFHELVMNAKQTYEALRKMRWTNSHELIIQIHFVYMYNHMGMHLGTQCACCELEYDEVRG